MTAPRGTMALLGLVGREFLDARRRSTHAVKSLLAEWKLRRTGTRRLEEKTARQYTDRGRWARAASVTIMFFMMVSMAEAIDQSLITCDQVRLFAARHNILFDSRLNRIRARAVALAEGLVLTSANIRAAAKCFSQTEGRIP